MLQLTNLARAAVITALTAMTITAHSGCTDPELAIVPPRQSVVPESTFPVSQNRELDILFVIDNSNSMEAEQRSLADNFPNFVATLEGIQGGLPDIHMGVISTDMGVGPGNNTCRSADGDNGRLRAEPSPNCQVQAPTGAFIKDILVDNKRETNYPDEQSLADTFSCIAEIGLNGCGFEQPLESLKRALDPSNVVNAGFLRPNAYLAVVFITDEDDCSAEDTGMYGTIENDIDQQLGRAGSFRCWEYGVRCDPDTPRIPGEKFECAPREDSPYMSNVQEYVDYLKQLKGQEELVIVAGIIGDSGPVVVERNEQDQLNLKKSCGAIAGQPYSGAVPATRLEAFLNSFQYSTTTSICNDDLSGALDDIAELLAMVVGNRCLVGELVDMDEATEGIQPTCSVTEIVAPGTLDERQRILPECDVITTPENANNQPCHVIRHNFESCTDTDTGLEIDVYPAERDLPFGTKISVQCEGR